MKVIRKQQGVTMITIALGLVVLAFFVTIAVTIWPVYLENFSVNSHLDRIAEDSKAKNMTKHELRKSLQRRFGVDDVESITATDVIIKGEPGEGYVIEADYEVRKNFMGNIDLVLFFNKVVETK